MLPPSATVDRNCLRRVLPAIAVALAIALAAGGCDRFPTGLGRYRDSVLVAGRGLDDILLGSTLHGFVQRFGAGQVTVIAGEAGYATDLGFKDQGMTFRFTLNGPCLAALAAGGNAEQAARGLAKPERFFKAYPSCRLAPLHSIAVQGRAFGGATDRGIRLGQHTGEVLARYGSIVALNAPPAAGDSPPNDRLDQASYANGIAFFVGDTGLAPTPGSDTTPRLWRATDDWTVRRIVIFDPGAGATG